MDDRHPKAHDTRIIAMMWERHDSASFYPCATKTTNKGYKWLPLGLNVRKDTTMGAWRIKRSPRKGVYNDVIPPKSKRVILKNVPSSDSYVTRNGHGTCETSSWSEK